LDRCRLTIARQHEIGATAGRKQHKGGNESTDHTD
jgi:hypothetical protein